ncbi:MAG: hypothetical protein IJL92_07845 [Thermoguttaceae bacterium]|nr:hypothetical protein [Thermoguttaceae bacterium]
MGSGSNGPYGYSSSGGGSQPYAPTYHVVKEMLDKDKQDHNIYDPQKGFFTNPYATLIQEAIENGQIQIDGHTAHGTYTYVVNINGDVIFGKRFNPNDSSGRAPHPTLIGGKDPQVQCAGMIRIEKGRIVWYNNDSGHFRPNARSLEVMDNAMRELREKHPNVFAKNYKGGCRR